jgi:hypothetical protein
VRGKMRAVDADITIHQVGFHYWDLEFGDEELTEITSRDVSELKERAEYIVGHSLEWVVVEADDG